MVAHQLDYPGSRLATARSLAIGLRGAPGVAWSVRPTARSWAVCPHPDERGPTCKHAWRRSWAAVFETRAVLALSPPFSPVPPPFSAPLLRPRSRSAAKSRRGSPNLRWTARGFAAGPRRRCRYPVHLSFLCLVAGGLGRLEVVGGGNGGLGFLGFLWHQLSRMVDLV